MKRFPAAILVVFFALCACSPQAAHPAEVIVTPQPTADELPTREITVESGFYLERNPEGTDLVEVQDFVPHEALIIDYPQTSSFGLEFEQDVTAIYCGEECFQIYFTEGDSHRVREVQENIKLYVEFADGTYAELAVNPPAAPQCVIIGVYFPDATTLAIKFSDYDGEGKMSLWAISGSGVDELDTLLYVDGSWDFNDYAFAGESSSGFAAVVGADYVSVFTDNNAMIDQVTPCQRG